MQDLRRALADIAAIRGQLAQGTEFRGYGPMTLAATGALAGLAAVVQATLLPDPAAVVRPWLALWIATALISMALIGWEALARARRAHGGLADAMISDAVLRFAPAAIAGAALPMALLHAAPESLWMLPGLWQLIFGLGACAAAAPLPRPMIAIGAWYLLTGLGLLAFAPGPAGGFSPWAMALPFGLGQAFAALLLLHVSRPDDDEA
jgi:hypothetical protein